MTSTRQSCGQVDATGVRELLKIKLERAGFKTMQQAAWRIGIGDSHLCQVMNGRANPGPKLLKWLGLKRVWYYEYVGLPELAALRDEQASDAERRKPLTQD